jgi:hemolysin activation/secretion protein
MNDMRKTISLGTLPRQHNILTAAILSVLIPCAVYAADAPTVAPDSGNILQQLKRSAPPVPASPATGLTIETQNSEQLSGGASFVLTALRITGNTRFDSATLHGLVADAEGKSLTLAQLNAVADRITDHYHSHGYPLARAIIPAQSIKDGSVVVQVLEARYGKVTLENRSHVTDSLLNSTLAPLRAGDVIEQTDMDHVLLLLSDIPKIDVNAVIKPGEAVGTSDLAVTTLPGPRFTGIATVDDYGNRYTGRTRGGATMSFIDPFGQGDFLSLAGLTSGEDLNYGRLSYEATATGLGTRLGGAFSGLHYKLGDGLEFLDGHGTATDASLWAKQPLIRSPNSNLNIQLQYDRTKLDDDLNYQSVKTARHLDTFALTLSGDNRDGLFGGGVSTGSLSVATGRVGFDNESAEANDAATARIQGKFTKYNLSLARLQRLSTTNSLYVSFAGQWTNDNLDSSQQMIAGGPYTVRSYDLGALSGDTGALGTVELQHDLGSILNGQWQASAFVDEEHLVINKNQFAPGANSATLRGAGAGLTWSGAHHWSARTVIAARFGSLPAIAPDSSTVRIWAELNREF